VDTGDAEEVMDASVDPHTLARRLSRQKAHAVAHRHKDALVIAADTFIAFKGRVLGKPRDARDAVRMLTMLSGRRHSVITGFTIMDTSTGKILSRAVETKVWFRRLSKAEIRAYVGSGEPMGKAGSYAIQGLGSVIVSRIEGDYSNVVGLPVHAVVASLSRFGVHVL
jgi:septum formation protein